MPSRFANHVVILTGAGSGIGQAAALAFAKAGAQVLGVGRRAEALRETADLHPAIETLSADVSATGAPERIVRAAVDRWGRVDVLVNNAGVLAMMPLGQVTAEGINQVLATNVTAPSLLASAALPYLRRSQGVIVNISSTFGHRPIAHASHYGASKAAIEQLTRSWALELAPDNIRVNAVAPGPTESGALAGAGLSAKEIDHLKDAEAARIPLGRRGEPDEVAEWILRLADARTAWLTGQVLTVDGGLELA
ncbi:SDR family oxidoreductase [Streptomyces sp. NBC_01724]|nr:MULTISPECIES: SDR family oxidoreductase [unclassified Streptomyces]WTE56776.1 SDR family oxidoreductase [Streptomyces sp. NBC_01620]WTE64846.1 SDR family oxidoreductase [Streptomyces sp. NBC_01617]WTI92191.1 SDR family oxidoreductase [Streptomyces sp. NBC_00724]WNO69647.1 SDR family oxidoreductase [Streptomyces sp. AM2-3-1]WSC74336.1 SDR family oxidoreductase [Streptomyces sp. NBC_01760]